MSSKPKSVTETEMVREISGPKTANRPRKGLTVRFILSRYLSWLSLFVGSMKVWDCSKQTWWGGD